MAREQYKEIIIGQYLFDVGEKRHQMVLNLPNLVIGSPPKARGIKNYAVVFAAAANLALHKLLHIINNPTHRHISRAACLSVLTAPCHACFGRVKMHNFRARRRAGAADDRRAGVPW